MKHYALLLLLAISPAFTSCLGLDKEYPERHFFILETVRPTKASDSEAPFSEASFSESRPILRVRPFRISPSYSGTEFLYRTSESAIESDYYNEFLIPPARLVTESAVAWLQASGLFDAVLGSSSTLQASYVLEGNVRSMYGDYRQPDRAQAVLELQVFLAPEAASEERIVLQRSYSKRVDVSGSTSEALMAGWNQCLTEVLTDLEEDLNRVLAEAIEASADVDRRD